MVTKSEEDSLYNALIVSLIIGIIITIIVLVITFEKPEPFTEIYYENPDSLPNKVRLNQNYSYSFTVHSLENSTKDYVYTSVLELFNLYDITETTYSCLTKYRDKIRLEWKSGEMIKNSTYDLIRYQNSSIPNMYTESVEQLQLEYINWTDYNIKFNYASTDGVGQTVVLFTDRVDRPRYAIILSEITDEVLFVMFQLDRLEISSKEYNFTPGRGYDIVMNQSLWIGRDEVAPLANVKGLKIGFETKDTLVSIRNLRIFRSNYSVKDVDTINLYDIEGGEMQTFHNKLTNERIDYLSLFPFSEISNNMFPIAFNAFSLEKNFTGQNSTIRHNENLTAHNITWSDYQYKYEFKKTDSSIFGYFINREDIIDYGFMISGDDAFFIRNLDDGLNINHVKIEQALKNKVNITIGDTASVYFNDFLIFDDLPIHKNMGEIRFDIFGQFVDITGIEVLNDMVNRSDRNLFEKYHKKYSIKNRPYIRDSSLISVFSNEITDVAEDVKTLAQAEDTPSYLLDDFQIEVKENVIKDSKIDLNGPGARLEDWNSYSFSFNYAMLDGQKQIKTTFKDLEGKEKYSFMIDETKKTMNFIDIASNIETKQDLEPEGQWHNFNIEYKENYTEVMFDREVIFNETLNLSSGSYMFETNDTYAHFRSARVNDYNGNIKNYQIEDDPCQLRKIMEIQIDKNQIILNPDENITIEQAFQLDNFFDYGKVTTLVGEQEIHFWVTRG